MINIGLIILIICLLIAVILSIILYNHLKIFYHNKKLKRKKEIWEYALGEYLNGSRTVDELAANLGNDYEVLKDFITPYLKNHSGENFNRLKKLVQEVGITDFYLKRLKNGSTTQKIKAANFLGKAREREALPLLEEMLYYNDSDVMIAAAWSIAEIGQENYFDLVLKAVLNHTNMTYEGITELCIQFGNEICNKIEKLISDWLQGRKDLEKIYQTKNEVIISLFIDLFGHFKYIQGAYQFEEILRIETNTEIIIHIFKALVKIGEPIDINLRAYLNHENWVVRSQAVSYAGTIEEKKYLSRYKELLQEDNNWWVKYYAAMTILRIGETNFLESLAETQTAGSKMSNYILGKR